MNQEMLERLSVITEEEREILNGRTEIDRTRYTKGDELVTSRQMEVRGAFHIDSGKMLEHGKRTPGLFIFQNINTTISK